MIRSKRPNILWISFEDCSPLYGCYGDSVAKTPNLDAFAAQGCLWKNAISTAPVCSPARGAIITGMYPISIGTHHHRTTVRDQYHDIPFRYEAVPPHYVKCIPEYLRHSGYYCTNNSKTDYQFEAPHTAWDECSDSAHWRNRPDRDQRFFAVFNLMKTHESQMWESAKPAPAVTDPAEVNVPPYYPDTPKVRRAIAKNYDNIAYNDRLFGELLADLEDDGLAENTIVFHWSDHGPSIRGKRWPYEAGVRVPMIVRWPEAAREGGSTIEPGTTDETVVSTIDLGPTILDLAGVPVPLHVQGQTFLDIPNPHDGTVRRAERRKYAYISRDRYDEMYDMVRACRDSRYKYIRHFHPELGYHGWNSYRNGHPIMQELIRCHVRGSLNEVQARLFQESRPVEELFDLDADPDELHNLAGDPEHEQTLTRMRAAVDEWRVTVGDMGEIPEDVMYRMWYPDRTQPQTIAPRIVLLGSELFGEDKRAPVPSEPLSFPVMMQLHAGTQGSSIEYQVVEESPGASGDRVSSGRWHLYQAPVQLPVGSLTLRSRAFRIGYAPSDVTEIAVDVVDTGATPTDPTGAP